MNKMKYIRLILAIALTVYMSLFQLITATATESPLLLLNYKEIDSEHFTVDISVKDVGEVIVVSLPLAYNPGSVEVCGYDSENSTFYAITDGVKKSKEILSGSQGIVINKSIVTDEDKWGGQIIANDMFPYISNSEGIIKLTMYTLNNYSLDGENEFLKIYFRKKSELPPKIRIASKYNTKYYDNVSPEGASLISRDGNIDVELVYNGNVFAPDEKIEYEENDSEAAKPVVPEGGTEEPPYSDVNTIIPDNGSIELPDNNNKIEGIHTDKKNIEYTDVDKDFWAYDFIVSLAEKNIINGYEDKSFKPTRSITRAELAKIAVIAKDISLSDSETQFQDVDSESWYSKYLSTAFENDIIKGYPDNTFKPDNYITREDLCTVLYRCFFPDQISEGTNSFSDKAMISDYALPAVDFLFENGILNGRDNNNFAPKDNATRAETAKIICLCLDSIK